MPTLCMYKKCSTLLHDTFYYITTISLSGLSTVFEQKRNYFSTILT